MASVRFTVFGRPQPAGSKRAFAHKTTGRIVVTDDAKGSRPWKQQVVWAAREAMGSRRPFAGPLSLRVEFCFARPKGHYRTGRNAYLLRETVANAPVVRPDATKLVRAVEDAMTGIVWWDDAQVVNQTVRKVYGLPERCDVWVDRE